MNRRYRPRSWSQQAREKCDQHVWFVNNGIETIQEAVEFFGNSYRAPIITMRAAKRFGRLRRQGKIKEIQGDRKEDN